MRSFGKHEAVERADIMIFQNDSSSVASPGNFKDMPTIAMASDDVVGAMSCKLFTDEVSDEIDVGVAEEQLSPGEDSKASCIVARTVRNGITR
jgi:hypothetical protein